MRKREILRHYKSSLNKWAEDVFRDIKEKLIREKVQGWLRVKGGYESKYWVECGFCEAHKKIEGECTECVLQKTKSFCDAIYDNESMASEILKLADKQQWPEAEKLCKQFIAKIKREIKKVEG